MKNKTFLLTLLAAGCASAFSMNDIIFWKLVRSTDADYTAKATTNALAGKADKTNAVIDLSLTLRGTNTANYYTSSWTNNVSGYTNGVLVIKKVYNNVTNTFYDLGN